MVNVNVIMDYEAVMKLALERGFYFPSCEVYADAQAGFWEYGPSGVSLKNKFLELWRRELIRRDWNARNRWLSDNVKISF